MSAADDLLAAVKAGDVARLEALLAGDPDLAGAYENGVSAARIALYHRQPDALRALLAAQPPLDGLDHAALGWADDLRADLATDPELVRRRSADGFTALHYACFFAPGGEAVDVLLEAGADPDAQAENPAVRPLHSATAVRNAEAVGLLLQAGADPNARQTGGITPLHEAAALDDQESAALLLRYGADPALRDDDGADAAGMARARGATAVLALLGVPGTL